MNISIDIFIYTHGSSWVPITTKLNSEVLNSCKETINIYIV